jgi:hypothetical protein
MGGGDQVPFGVAATGGDGEAVGETVGDGLTLADDGALGVVFGVGVGVQPDKHTSGSRSENQPTLPRP